MRLSRWIVPLVLLAPALMAGCATPDEASASPPTDGTSSQPPAARPPAGFQLEGPTITPLDGREGPLREDDGALIRYTLRAPADAAGPSSALVSYLLDGEVTAVDNVELAPGQSRTWERNLTQVRDRDEIHVEVRAGAARGEATASVLPWPRVGETVSFDPYFLVRVDNWTRDETTAATLVGVTLRRGVHEFSEFRVHLLCADAEGKATSLAVVRPDVQPVPNAVDSFEMRFPLCPATGTTYGVDVKANTPEGKGAQGRVLFVPVGWTPPGAAPT